MFRRIDIIVRSAVPQQVRGTTIRSIRAEAWIAMASCVIALAALWTAEESNRQNRIHNMLSVRPVLKIIRAADSSGAGIVLSNKGLGPAIVKTLRYWADGRELTGRDGVFRRAGLGGIPGVEYYSGSNLVNAPISANEEFRLIWALLPKSAHGLPHPGALLGAQLGLREITWDYCYCSIYGECWHSETGDLNVRPVSDCSAFRSAFRPVPSN